MSNKPDVLSKEEMDKAYCLADLHRDKLGHHAVAQTQRDADVEWFNSEYSIKYREEADEVGHFIDKGWIPPEQYKINIQQIRQGVAREIFEVYDAYIKLLGEEIDSLIGLAISHGWQSSKVEAGENCRANIKSLKDKFLKEDK